MFEEIIKTEINNTTLVILRNTKRKDSPKSKNYLTIYYHHLPETETLKTQPPQTFYKLGEYFLICKMQ